MQKIWKIPRVQFLKNFKISVWGLLAQKKTEQDFFKEAGFITF